MGVVSKLIRLCGLRDWFYRVHVVTGLVVGFWLLLIGVTGVLINHQESLGLLDAEISDRYLPSFYRADARTGTTRLNVVITDLHSGRILGAQGYWISDLVALLLVTSLATGFFSYQIKRRVQQANHKEAFHNAPPPAARESRTLPASVAATGSEHS